MQESARLEGKIGPRSGCAHYFLAGRQAQGTMQATMCWPFLDWPLMRFLTVIFCLVGIGAGLGYMMVTDPDWKVSGVETNSKQGR
jgi:hypothetical protein